MGNVGRFFCVALPFILTAASIIAMLVVGLVGVTDNKNLYMFRVNATGLRLNSSTIQDIVGTFSKRDLLFDERNIGDVVASATDTLKSGAGTATSSGAAALQSFASANGINVGTDGTVSVPQFAYIYDVNLWGYCQTSTNGTRTCTKAEFNWAEKTFNTTSVNVASSQLSSAASAAGVNTGTTNFTLPDSIQDSLTAFKAVAKWTEVVYIIALVALALELFVGLFTYCSRLVSCVTYLISGVATAAVIAAAVMVTVMSSLVVGAIKASATVYGVDGSINTSYLAGIWIAAAFAVGASMFWLFSACCCKRDHTPKRRRGKHHDDEKPFLPNGSYAPLAGNNNSRHSRHASYGYAHPTHGAPRSGNARSDLAYEPYSHSNV